MDAKAKAKARASCLHLRKSLLHLCHLLLLLLLLLGCKHRTLHHHGLLKAHATKLTHLWLLWLLWLLGLLHHWKLVGVCLHAHTLLLCLLWLHGVC